jgi:hypothetical protein
VTGSTIGSSNDAPGVIPPRKNRKIRHDCDLPTAHHRTHVLPVRGQAPRRYTLRPKIRFLYGAVALAATVT